MSSVCVACPSWSRELCCVDFTSPELLSSAFLQIGWIPTQTTPIRRRVEFKLACLVHQSLAGHIPTYLTSNIQLLPTLATLSSDLHLRRYVLFHAHTTASVTQVSLLPVLVCGTPCLHIRGRTWIIDISKEHWRDNVYVVVDHGALWLIVFVRLSSSLTYLLTYDHWLFSRLGGSQRWQTEHHHQSSPITWYARGTCRRTMCEVMCDTKIHVSLHWRTYVDMAREYTGKDSGLHGARATPSKHQWSSSR